MGLFKRKESPEAAAARHAEELHAEELRKLKAERVLLEAQSNQMVQNIQTAEHQAAKDQEILRQQRIQQMAKTSQEMSQSSESHNQQMQLQHMGVAQQLQQKMANHHTSQREGQAKAVIAQYKAQQEQLRVQKLVGGGQQASTPVMEDPSRVPGCIPFQHALQHRKPGHILIGQDADEQFHHIPVSDIFHAIWTGPSGGGKSLLNNLFLSQLLAEGVEVWIADPHMCMVDPDDGTDYRPILDKAKLKARDIPEIERALEAFVAEMDSRIDKRYDGISVGHPMFLSLDELPMIIQKIKKATQWIERIVREARKVKMFVGISSQDMLQSTLKFSGGEIRDNFRIAMILKGTGDTTARKLLGEAPKDIKELPVGVGYFRTEHGGVKLRIPMSTNESVYQLLGKPGDPQRQRGVDSSTHYTPPPPRTEQAPPPASSGAAGQPSPGHTSQQPAHRMRKVSGRVLRAMGLPAPLAETISYKNERGQMVSVSIQGLDRAKAGRVYKQCLAEKRTKTDAALTASTEIGITGSKTKRILIIKHILRL